MKHKKSFIWIEYFFRDHRACILFYYFIMASSCLCGYIDSSLSYTIELYVVLDYLQSYTYSIILDFWPTNTKIRNRLM